MVGVLVLLFVFNVRHVGKDLFDNNLDEAEAKEPNDETNGIIARQQKHQGPRNK